jgi:hypothetical protein
VLPAAEAAASSSATVRPTTAPFGPGATPDRGKRTNLPEVSFTVTNSASAESMVPTLPPCEPLTSGTGRNLLVRAGQSLFDFGIHLRTGHRHDEPTIVGGEGRLGQPHFMLVGLQDDEIAIDRGDRADLTARRVADLGASGPVRGSAALFAGCAAA